MHARFVSPRGLQRVLVCEGRQKIPLDRYESTILQTRHDNDEHSQNRMNFSTFGRKDRIEHVLRDSFFDCWEDDHVQD